MPSHWQDCLWAGFALPFGQQQKILKMAEIGEKFQAPSL